MTGAIHQEIAGLEPGGHICLPYVSTEDHESAIAAFVRGGLRRGERCLYIGSQAARDGIAKRLHEEGIPVSRAFCPLWSKCKWQLITRRMSAGEHPANSAV